MSSPRHSYTILTSVQQWQMPMCLRCEFLFNNNNNNNNNNNSSNNKQNNLARRGNHGPTPHLQKGRGIGTSLARTEEDTIFSLAFSRDDPHL